MKSNQANSAAIRAFRILEILAESKRPLSLADIVAAIELPKPTVHRILQQLQESWLIARSVGSRHYECSSRVNRFSLNLIMHSGAAVERHAILRDLAEQIGETCNLTMLNGTEIVYIDRVETQWPLRVHLQPGSTVPVHCTATGKLLLSLLPKGKRDKLLKTLPLPASAGNAITDRIMLRREIEITRKRRIGINNQENLQGIIAVAVPVMLDRNRACAAIAAQAPVARMSLDQLMGYVPALKQAAESVRETFTAGGGPE
ncbi:MAG: IclR family transcriptional regulator [Betaproteobacteria bacterium]|nr:IclR family transcriptional regulator [Betaproteobacteria bacterium]